MYRFPCTNRPNIAVPREKRRGLFEVSTRHLAVVHNGVLQCPCVPRLSNSALSVTIITFRSAARILIRARAPFAFFCPAAGPGAEFVDDIIVVGEHVNLTENEYEESRFPLAALRPFVRDAFRSRGHSAVAVIIMAFPLQRDFSSDSYIETARMTFKGELVLNR